MEHNRHGQESSERDDIKLVYVLLKGQGRFHIGNLTLSCAVMGEPMYLTRHGQCQESTAHFASSLFHTTQALLATPKDSGVQQLLIRILKFLQILTATLVVLVATLP